VSKVRFLDKEFGELTSLMLSNKLHYDQVSDEMTSRIELMQVRLNKENISLQSQIKETQQHWSLQIRTLDNELQSTIKRIDKIKKESQFRVVPASELFAQENLERQVQYLTERLDALTNKDEKSSKKQGSHFNRVPAEDLLNDATPIMDWANEKLHEDEPNKVEEPNEEPSEEPSEEPIEEPNEEPTPIPSESQTESELTEKERRQVALKEALDLIMDKYKISLPNAKLVLKWILEKAKEKEEGKIESKVEPHVEQQSKRRGRPRKETQQVVDEVITTPTLLSKSKKRQPLFTTKEVHNEILRKLKIKWFTLRKKYGEAYYERQYKKAYKRLYYYKYEANSSPKETILTQTPTKENNTKNYESIF
jgi:hypothetical protein